MVINGTNELRKNLKFVQPVKVENGKKKRKMNRGYVKLWRKSIDSGFFQNPNLWTFWCWCLMKASHKKIKQVVGFQNIELLPGQFLFGRKAASVELKMSERTIRTSLDALRKRQNIAIKTTNKFSIITVINWDTYQCDRPTSDQQNDQQTTSKRPASDHKQECKTFKNEKNININCAKNCACEICFNRFWDLYDKKRDRKKCFQKWKRLKQDERDKIFQTLPAYIESTKDVQFRKDPATYLNNQSWNNEIIKVNKDGANKQDFRDPNYYKDSTANYNPYF